jgi:hypothetical protein
MYDYYFNDKIIDKALKTNQWCEEKVEHYMNHVINFINPNRNVNALKGLRQLWMTLDLRNIDRLKSTDDALNVALEMAKIILNNVPDYVEEKQEETPPAGGNAPSEGEEMTLMDKIKERIQTLEAVPGGAYQTEVNILREKFNELAKIVE